MNFAHPNKLVLSLLTTPSTIWTRPVLMSFIPAFLSREPASFKTQYLIYAFKSHYLKNVRLMKSFIIRCEMFLFLMVISMYLVFLNGIKGRLTSTSRLKIITWFYTVALLINTTYNIVLNNLNIAEIESNKTEMFNNWNWSTKIAQTITEMNMN